MLTRIFVHNFRTFVNFEVRLDALRLLMGPNGAGKTALMDVLERLRQLVCESARILDSFPLSERSLGLANAEGAMQFELDLLDAQGGLYTYGLRIDIDTERGLQRIGREWLHYNGKPLFSAERARPSSTAMITPPGQAFRWTGRCQGSAFS